jgi:hypothetical protein
MTLEPRRVINFRPGLPGRVGTVEPDQDGLTFPKVRFRSWDGSVLIERCRRDRLVALSEAEWALRAGGPS